MSRLDIRLRIAQAGILLTGLGLLVTGISLILAPAWFFANIGTFGAMNRHYMGDLGAFLLPLGLALLPAARNPAAHRPLLAMAACGSLLHSLNHAYDAWLMGAGLTHWLVDTGPIALGGLWLTWAWFVALPRGRARAAS